MKVALKATIEAMQSTMLYPVLYWREAPWARPFYKSIMPTLGKVNRKEFDGACLNLLMPLLLRRRGIHSVTALDTQARMDFSMDLSEEHKGLLSWAEWVNRGRETLQVAAPLALELAASKTGELVMRDVLDLSGSAMALYVHFSLPAEHLGLIDGKTAVEGAYILLAPDHSVRLVLVGRGHGANEKDLLPCTGRYDLRLLAGSFDLPVEEAVEAALEADLRDIELARLTARNQTFADGDELFDRLRNRMVGNREVYRRAVSFLINVLAYKKWVSTGQRRGWTEDAPRDLTSKLDSASRRQRDIIEDKLWNLGFTRVSQLGEEFVAVSAGQGVSMHLRDGHWRNQAHGPAHSLRKLIWIRPALVGGKTG